MSLSYLYSEQLLLLLIRFDKDLNKEVAIKVIDLEESWVHFLFCFFFSSFMQFSSCDFGWYNVCCLIRWVATFMILWMIKDSNLSLAFTILIACLVENTIMLSNFLTNLFTWHLAEKMRSKIFRRYLLLTSISVLYICV